MSDGFYISIRDRLRELKGSNPKVSFFFSAGLGNTDHANNLAATLFPELLNQQPPNAGKIFISNGVSKEGTLPSKTWGTKFLSTPLKGGNAMEKGTFLSSFPAFKNLTGIFDYANEAHTNSTESLGNCFADPIVAANVQTVVVDNCGKNVGAAGLFGSHKVYLEGNAARFYGPPAGANQAGGADYFLRIISSLM